MSNFSNDTQKRKVIGDDDDESEHHSLSDFDGDAIRQFSQLSV